MEQGHGQQQEAPRWGRCETVCQVVYILTIRGLMLSDEVYMQAAQIYQGVCRSVGCCCCCAAPTQAYIYREWTLELKGCMIARCRGRCPPLLSGMLWQANSLGLFGVSVSVDDVWK